MNQRVIFPNDEGGVDKTATEANIEQQIQTQINPPVVVLHLPWVQ